MKSELTKKMTLKTKLQMRFVIFNFYPIRHNIEGPKILTKLNDSVIPGHYFIIVLTVGQIGRVIWERDPGHTNLSKPNQYFFQSLLATGEEIFCSIKISRRGNLVGSTSDKICPLKFT